MKKHLPLSFLVLLLNFTFGTLICFAQKTESSKESKAAAVRADTLLAGKQFIIELSEKNQKNISKLQKDELSFDSGELYSKFGFAKNQFPAVVYSASIDSNPTLQSAITFQCESKSWGEVIKWNGVITNNNAISGTAIWTSKKGETIHEYSFTGTLQTKKKKS